MLLRVVPHRAELHEPSNVQNARAILSDIRVSTGSTPTQALLTKMTTPLNQF